MTSGYCDMTHRRNRSSLTVILTVAVLCLPSCGSEQKLPAVRAREYEATSVAELLAKPETFDSVRVTVNGWLRLEFEGNALYASQDAFVAHRTREAVWLEVPGAMRGELVAVNGNRVDVMARFSASEHGHLGAYAGSLLEIQAITRSP